ncbi:MAG TPA: cupin domain-containing protein [Eubacteriales bacterium]|jgi:quercetin dioxygenase-like cupin family protein|nr:cupin domain-containing protein [Clostridia bacterium]HRR89298.1 cupin domain-containing protein [Eubacteriales bacterium]HRU84464.1 cupin domain-containing protein [Eubacteriales bacterium]
MVEQVFKLSNGGGKVVERVIADENINYAHIVLMKGDAVPEHTTNSNVYMTVVCGRLAIALEGQDFHEYEAGTVLKIPLGIKMKFQNLYDGELELIIVKAPAPTV